MDRLPEIPKSGSIKDLPLDKQIEVAFKGTCALREFAESRVSEILRAVLQMDSYEQALAGTYYRLCLLMGSLAALSDPRHFQVTQMIARAVFELLLDLKLLEEDKTLTDQYWAFTTVSKFDKARKLAEFLDDNPEVDRARHEGALKLANDATARQKAEQLCEQHWRQTSKERLRWPEHWSNRNVFDRAQDAGLQYCELYRSQFFIQSYYVHAGAAGIDSLSPDAFKRAFALAHLLSQRLFADATRIVCEKFHLFEGDEQLREDLNLASAMSGYYACLEELKLAGSGDIPDTTGSDKGGTS